MPTVTNPALSAIEHAGSGNDVTLEISYVAVFSPLERHLAAHGLVFEEHVSIFGEDMGRSADLVLHNLPPEPIDVSAGTTPLRVPRRRILTVTRQSLREDRGLGSDEIDARIDIVAVGLPAAIVTAMTPQLSLTAPVTSSD